MLRYPRYCYDTRNRIREGTQNNIVVVEYLVGDDPLWKVFPCLLACQQRLSIIKNLKINEIIIAVCCELDTVDIKIPNESAVTMNKTVSKANNIKFPVIGILKTKNPKSKITVALMMDKKI